MTSTFKELFDEIVEEAVEEAFEKDLKEAKEKAWQAQEKVGRAKEKAEAAQAKAEEARAAAEIIAKAERTWRVSQIIRNYFRKGGEDAGFIASILDLPVDYVQRVHDRMYTDQRKSIYYD